MIKFFVFFGNLLGFIFPTKLLENIIIIFDLLRTGWLKTSLKSLGDGTVLRKNVKIIGGQQIIIGKHCVIQSQSILSTWGDNNSPLKAKLIINDNVIIGEGCHLTAINSIVIGQGTLLGKNITITDNSHGLIIADEADVLPTKRKLYSKGPVAVGNKVWIGDKVTILPGVTIGNSSIIGANSVVTKDIPPRSVVVGNPAKVIKCY